ncbi:MAG TPA: LysE family transporter [Chthoniobacterales bacterium]|nr:LysE family transporter [Chthoniobacterales bacterium]
MSFSLSSGTLLTGFILGWSVAWPPGPINAEMIRRALLPETRGGGFWPAWILGLGACTGDFIWALGVSTGAGALLNTPTVRLVLGGISLALLLFLAGAFALGAWRAARSPKPNPATAEPQGNPLRRNLFQGYLLGLSVALTSPWNIGFWLAVIGSQSGPGRTMVDCLLLALAVVMGAITWGCLLCLALKMGARFFVRPGWQIATQALTALVMLYFAARLLLRLI